MEWIYFSSFAAVFLIVFGTGLIIFSIIRRRRRQPLFSGRFSGINHYCFDREMTHILDLFERNRETLIRNERLYFKNIISKCDRMLSVSECDLHRKVVCC